MRGRLAIIITVGLVLLLLVFLNAASYVSVERTPDSEYRPDRSTYNSGATGTRALYDFLSETNRQVTRWREAPGMLLKTTDGGIQPRTFVVIGETRIDFDEDAARDLMEWVRRGGRLVIIDRRPDIRLLPPSGDWHISTQLAPLPSSDVHSDNVQEMTKGVTTARAAQPTLLTQKVNEVLPSRFASLVRVAATRAPGAQPSPSASPAQAPAGNADDEDESNSYGDYEPPPPPRPLPRGRDATPPPQPPASASSFAPVVHLTDNRGALLVDYPHGLGRIVILSDPFIVANRGINQANNLQLAINVLTETDGLIAFDEYHQGRGTSRNELLSYFSGTPLVAMLVQLGLIVLAVFWTSGRRFARPLPVPQVDRRSSLEYVASMAELQQRARAYDLAIENIYMRIRRVLARYAGVDMHSPRALIAERVAARSSKVDRHELETLMFECEDAINGAPVDAKKSLSLISRLREIERLLGLRMRSRDMRQAKEQLGQ
ncbi:MAG TPA: DUF4350 domain-containing protein [Pyrinomonadaceae bacterium]|jgi:hypothetical protein